MAAFDSTTAPANLFRDWDLTPAGSFHNKVTKQDLSREEWEMEMAYMYADNPDALEYARTMSQEAARRVEAKTARPSPLLLARRRTA